ncbi:hypothetical protein ACP70R_005882 [Stipagrostis hirtigluma subsp. patula]
MRTLLSRPTLGLLRRRLCPSAGRVAAASAPPRRWFSCATANCAIDDTAKPPSHATTEIIDHDPMSPNFIWYPTIIPDSTHRDGAIYENMRLEYDWPDVDFADRGETRLEPMMLTRATKWCLPDVEDCIHFPAPMLQFFSLTLAECLVAGDGSTTVQLYGYIAARDRRDRMLNYVFHRSRDDPIVVNQGSLIEMTGPKRGIELVAPVLIEYDVRIKNNNGDREEDDLELIDGAIEFNDRRPWRPTKHRVDGAHGAVDMALSCIDQDAVEATIEVVVSEVRRGFSFSLSSFVRIRDIIDDYHEIKLFDGTIDRSRGLRRYVVAVTWDTVMLLRFRIGDAVERQHFFKAKLHGCARRQIRLKKFANVSVKVTWSTV